MTTNEQTNREEGLQRLRELRKEIDTEKNTAILRLRIGEYLILASELDEYGDV